VVPQPFAGGGNWSYLELWAVTGDLRYRGTRPQQQYTKHVLTTKQVVQKGSTSHYHRVNQRIA
jgi:ABC-type sulfate transport system substrate-binding protein